MTIEGVIHIHHSSRAGVSPSDGLVSHPKHSLEGSNPSAEMQLAYSTTPADCVDFIFLFLQASSDNLYVSKVKLATVVEGDQKAPFSIATTPNPSSVLETKSLFWLMNRD